MASTGGRVWRMGGWKGSDGRVERHLYFSFLFFFINIADSDLPRRILLELETPRSCGGVSLDISNFY
jgi:hypothetical protein